MSGTISNSGGLSFIPSTHLIGTFIFYPALFITVLTSINRSISSIQGRPLGLRDETFDMRVPEAREIDPIGDGMTLASFQMAVLRYSSYRFRLDLVISDIKEHLYYLPSKSPQTSAPLSPDMHQDRIRLVLDAWWEETVLGLAATNSGVGSRQKNTWRLKLEIKYHLALVLLYQPSQEIRNPSQDHLLQCFNSACSILDNYQALYENKALYHGWFTVQNIFAAGATLVYSFWTSPAVRRDATGVQLLRRLRTCSNLLSAGGEWWPSARKGLESFGSVVDLTIQRLYDGDSVVSKQRRITAPGDSVSSRVSSLHHGTAEPDAVPATHQHTSSSSTVANLSQPWTQPYDFPHDTGPGSWTSTSEYPENDPRRPFSAISDEDPHVPGAQGLFPEIEDFLADFNRSEFSWNFPMGGPQENHSIGDTWAAGL